MDKILKFAIIGIGDRGDHCWGAGIAAREDCRITAICDTNKVRLAEGGKKYGVKALYGDLDEMLASEKLDAAIITTPDCFHDAVAVKALKAGVNILIDKPIATTVKGGKAIIKAAAKSKAIAMMGFNLRHAPTLMKLHDLIANGELGRVFLIENREFYDGGRTYMARWNGNKKFSGSLWIHKGCHDFDVFDWLLGFPKPVKVTAFAGMNVLRPENIPFKLEKGIQPGPSCWECHYGVNGTQACLDCCVYKERNKWGEKAQKVDGYVKDSCMYSAVFDAHDNGIAMVEYENGVRASHMECFIGAKSDRYYTIIGTLGTAEASLAERRIVVTKRWSGEKVTYDIPETTGSHGGADPGLLNSFIRTIRGLEPNTSTLEQGLVSTSIGQAAELSKVENRTVFISELMK